MAKAKRKKATKKRPTAGRKTISKVKSGKTAGSRPGSRRPKHEKAAIRSDAFAKAILEAKSYRDDPDSLRELFELASARVAAIPSNALNELGPYLQAMLRLIRAYAQGDYRDIPRAALLTIVAAISYLVDPFDLIPDEVPFLGFVDDATVIGFAVSRARGPLDDFMIWERIEHLRQ
ncbi:MAG TPA: DUF1232 domain-containing protein [Chthoniobacterales bacterium]|nr:DUF1232 domain-containing protein [Chthoniobacterales bacterium]